MQLPRKVNITLLPTSPLTVAYTLGLKQHSMLDTWLAVAIVAMRTNGYLVASLLEACLSRALKILGKRLWRGCWPLYYWPWARWYLVKLLYAAAL